MSRTSILAILAGAGIAFSGPVTADAMAFARAIQTDNSVQLARFANQFPDSPYSAKALKIAETCIGNWVNAGCTTPPVGNEELFLKNPDANKPKSNENRPTYAK
jgi:hypothetical protein